MKKFLLSATAFVLLFASCNSNNNNNNVTPGTNTNNNNTNNNNNNNNNTTTSYYIKCKMNGVDWVNNTYGMYWQKVFTGSDTQMVFAGQGNYNNTMWGFQMMVDPGTYNGVGNYTDTIINMQFQLPGTIDPVYLYFSPIDGQDCQINVTYDDGTTVKGTFHGWMTNSNTPTDDTITITNGDFVLKKLL